MVSLIKTSFLFFLLFKIIFITSPMNVWHRIGSSSSKSLSRSSSDVEQVPTDPKERCLWELDKIFKDDSGLNNFLYALLNLNESSFEDNEQCLTRTYFFDLFNTLRQIEIDLPDLRTPQDYCHQMLPYQRDTCLPDFEGANCIKYIYRSWNLRALPGTEHLTTTQLWNEIRLKYDLCHEEYNRRCNQPAPFDEYYAKYLHEVLQGFGGSAFSDRTDFCDSYISKQQIPLTINQHMVDPYDSHTDDPISEEMDPYDSDTDDLNSYISNNNK